MFKKLVFTAVLAGVAALVYTQMPELKRYWRIRNM
jgi:hypothetical protein